MAATTSVAPVEDDKPTPMIDKKDPPKKDEATVAMATEVPLVMPLEDERMAQVKEEAPRKVEATKMAKEEEDIPKKVVASGQEKKEDKGLNGKGEAFWSQEVKNDEVEGEADESGKVEEAEEGAEGQSSGAVEELALQDTKATVFVVEPTLTPPLESNDDEDIGGATKVVDHENKVDDDNIIKDVTNVIDADNDKVQGREGGDDGGEPEVAGEDAKARALDAGEVMKDDDSREPVSQDIEAPVPVVELGLAVEYKSKSSELGEEDGAMASLDAPKGEDKSELWKEREEKLVATVEEKVTDKMADDVKAVVTEEEKPKLEGEKAVEAGYGGGDGGELVEEKEVEVSTISVEATKLGDEVALFAKANGELGYEKEASGDIMIVGGEEAPEESTTNDVDVEDEVDKLELASEIVHSGSIEEVYPASAHSVLTNRHGKKQNIQGHTNASEGVEEVGVEKPTEVENVAAAIEDISLEKPIEIENVVIEVEGIDVEMPMEVKHFTASSVDGILSRELTPESSKENNSVEETEGATKVVNHEKKIDDDGIIDAMINIKMDVDVEDEVTKPELASEVVHGGSIEEVYLASAQSVLEHSHGKEKIDEGLTNASEVVEEIGVEKPLKVENLGGAIEYVGFVKPSKIENVPIAVEGINDKNPMEVENVVASSVDGTLSRELAPKSSKENNNVEETEGANKVVIHEEKVDDDGIIDAMTNVIDAKNDEAQGDGGGDDGVVLEEHAKGGSLGTVEAVKDDDGMEPVEQDTEVVVSVVEMVPEQILEPKWGNSEIGENEDAMASPNEPEDGDKGELEEEVYAMVEAKVTDKVIDDAKATAAKEEKELKSEKVAKHVVTKHDPVSKASIVVVHDGSIDEVDPASRDSVLEDSPEKDQNFEGQANASKAMEDVGADKPLYVEVATTVETISVEKPIELEIVAIVVEDVDVEKLMEVENVVAYSDESIISQELAAKSSKENNDVGETEDATEVVDHEEEVLNDNIIEAMTNVTDAKNDEAEGDRKESDGRVVEEAEEDAKDKSLGEAKAMKDDGGTKPTVQDKKAAISMIELVPVLVVEPKLEHSEFDEDAMASSNATKGEDKDEWQEKEKLGVMVEAKVMDKVVDDAKSAVVGEEKLEPEDEKGEEVGYGGGDGGELGEEKQAKASTINVEDKVILFVEGNGRLDYDREASDDIVAIGGEEVMEASIEKDADVENEVAKPEPMREASTMVVHDGSVQVVDPTSVDIVLKDSIGKEQNVERQATTSEALQDVNVKKILEVENVAARAEDIGIENPIEVENIIVDVEGVNARKSIEDENIAPSSANDILPRKLAPKSKKEKNDAEKNEDATKVIDQVEEIDDDGIIEDSKNVIYTKNGEAECDREGDDDGEVQDVEGETTDRILNAAEDVKDNDGKKPIVQDVEAVISMVEPDLASVVDFQSENSKLGEDDATMASLDALEGEDKGGFWEERKEEEVGASVEVKIVYKVEDDVKVVVVEQDKLKLEGGKGDEVGYEGGDSDKLGEEKGAKVSVEADELKDEVALLSKDEGELDYKKEASNDTVVVGGEEALEESIGKDIAIEDEVAKPKLVSEVNVEVNPQSNFVDNNIGSVGNAGNSIDAPIQVLHDGSVVEVDPSNADSVLEDSPDKEQNAEGMSTASEAMEDGGVKKPLGDEDIVVVVEDMGLEKNKELESIVVPIEGIDVEKPIKVENVVVSSTDGILFQELAPESSIENKHAGEMEGATEVVDYGDEVNDDIGIKAVTDDKNGVGDEADDGANSKTSGSLDRNIILCSQDDPRILIMDQPPGLGSSVSFLWPTPPHKTAQSKILNTLELALTDAHSEEMNEEDKKVNDKVELIKVKFLRLLYKLGATLEETVPAQVMYRLSLTEGIIHGWQMDRAFNFDNAQKKALILEAEGKHDLNFSCNILVLGKTGVGKSATINSIFGEEKLKTDAFNSATTSVQEIVGDVHGVKIRIIDTPGLLPNVMDQASNRKILVAVKKYTRKCPPDIVLYVDRLDCLSRDLNDLPLLKTITDILGSSIWFDTIVALTHAASPPEGLNGTPMPYDVLMAQSSHIIQQSIRQATRDMRLMNPVTLVENHPSCMRNSESQKVLPNDQSWRHQMLLLCHSAKILSEANSLLKPQDPNPEMISRFHFRSHPLHFLLSSLLQSRANPKLSIEQGGNEGNSDVELDDYFDVEQDDGEEEYSQFPPSKPLTKTQLARLTKQQKNVYFDEYDYMVKLFQKKQWKDEIHRLKEMKKRGTDLDGYGHYANIAGENDQDPPPKSVSVPLRDIVLPPSFDCDNPTYRYRFLQTTSTVLARPILDAYGWDHDCGYDGISMEDTFAILNRFPGNVEVQVTKNKKEFSIRLDSSIAAKHGENASSLAGFDIQTVGQRLAYILHGETKIKNIKKSKTTGGFSVTFLGDIVATGLKVEDQLSLGKRLSLVASTGAMQAQGDTAYGANLEARLKDKDYPIGQSLLTLGLCLMKWRQDLALGANLQSQFSTGRGSKMALRLGLNNKLSGKITIKTSTSEQVQIALLGLVPVATSIYRSFRPSEP